MGRAEKKDEKSQDEIRPSAVLYFRFYLGHRKTILVGSTVVLVFRSDPGIDGRCRLRFEVLVQLFPTRCVMNIRAHGGRRSLSPGELLMGLKFVCLCAVFCLIIFATGCSLASSPRTVAVKTLPIKVVVSPQATAIATGQGALFTAAVDNDDTGVIWSTTAGTIDADGNYTAPSGPQSVAAVVVATSKADPTESSRATVNVVAPGQVTATANVQVALYTISPPTAAQVSVQFGIDTNYKLTTWTQPAPVGGGTVSLFVAGMLGNTLYHMRGMVQFSDGSQYTDPDLTFTTGAYPTAQMPVFTVTTTPGMTPQSGVELLDLLSPGTGVAPAAITDLNGNILWSYNPALAGQLNPIKLLPNGHILLNFSASSPDGSNSILQEVDLSGKVIWQETAADLNNALAAATCAGCKITVLGTHHDFLILPSGHLILLAATQQVVSGATITGDVLIDLDQNHKPVWLWNEFDHLDTSRQPFGGVDWTHSNAVIYSADDGNLIVSMRHQNWVVKVDYKNGAGTGNILWKLGYQGDFVLAGGTDPTDWFYAQHGPSFVTANTTGKFSLVLFDNGNDRFFPSGQVLCTTVATSTCYSTVPVLQLDETLKIATLTFHAQAPFYSYFGGNAAVLKNGNIEYCETTGFHGGDIYEVTQDSNALVVWHMQSAFNAASAYPYAYRGQRIPSFYPGVQW
jgi:arylsulfate sulfotransferase